MSPAKKTPGKGSSRGKGTARSPVRPLRTITRFWIALLVVGVIGYAASLVIARTDGFRSLVAESLAKRAGLPLRMETSSLSPGWTLRLEGIRSTGDDRTGGEIRIASASLDLSLLTWLKGQGWITAVSIHGGSVTLSRPSVNDPWQPSGLDRLNHLLGPWLGILPAAQPAPAGSGTPPVAPPDDAPTGTPGPVPPGMPEGWRLTIRNLNLVWQEASGVVPAAVEGLRVDVQGATLLEDPVILYEVGADRMRRDSDILTAGLAIRGIRIGDRDIGLSMEGDTDDLAVRPSISSADLTPAARRALDLMDQFDAGPDGPASRSAKP